MSNLLTPFMVNGLVIFTSVNIALNKVAVESISGNAIWIRNSSATRMTGV